MSALDLARGNRLALHSISVSSTGAQMANARRQQGAQGLRACSHGLTCAVQCSDAHKSCQPSVPTLVLPQLAALQPFILSPKPVTCNPRPKPETRNPKPGSSQLCDQHRAQGQNLCCVASKSLSPWRLRGDTHTHTRREKERAGGRDRER